MRLLLLFILISPSLFASELSLNYSNLDGGIYFGGYKTPIEITKVSLEYNKSYTYLNWGVQADYLGNESEFKVYQLALELGVHKRINNWKLGLNTQMGLGVYHEESNMQRSADIGPTVGLETYLSYYYKKNIFKIGYHWQHTYWGSSYWGNDIFDDIALDVRGLFFSIGYNFK